MTQQGAYPVRPSVDERLRLSVQDELFNRALPVVPSGLKPPKRVLDVACGTGGWLREMARLYPQAELVGLDKNGLLLEYAKTVALAKDLAITYRIGDMFSLEKTFKSKQFDLIHMRSSTWFLGDKIADVFATCQQLLAPGGTFYVVDFEQPYPTTSQAMRRYGTLFYQAMEKQGTMFKGTAEITALFHSLSFTNIRPGAAVIDLCAGAPNRNDFLSDVRRTFSVFKAMIIDAGLQTDEEYEALKQQCLEDMDKPDYGFLAFFLCISGQKL